MTSISNFLAMGGYGTYVWPAYGAALCIIAWMMYGSFRAVKKAEAADIALKNHEK